MSVKKKDREKLDLWKKRLSENELAYSEELDSMDHREALYRGTDEIFKAHTGENTKYTRATHVYNVVAELIEAQVDTNIPTPKVTPMHPEDEGLAIMIENMLRNELDRLNFEEMNDMTERTVPIQGGCFFLVEWDNAKKPYGRDGSICVSTIHPKQLIPQDGVYDSIESMDYIILKVPQTKKYIRDKYGVDVRDESEEEPEVRRAEDDAESAADMVTQYIGYARNEHGGIDYFSWVQDTIVEDIEDYQARRLRRCKKCGAIEGESPPSIAREDGEIAQTEDGSYPLDTESPARDARKPKKNVCAYCGASDWEDSEEDYQEIVDPIPLPDGRMIPGSRIEIAEDGSVNVVPTRIPYYKPDIFPVIIMKNVSSYGKLLGESDADKLEYQQNTINRLATSINDKLLKRGSYMTLPRNAKIPVNDEDGNVIYVDDVAQMSMINIRNIDFDVDQDMARMASVYEEAKNVIGITDSFLGRRDTTATSGKAKEFSAAQSAGRMESKRVTKHAAYARLFDTIFKFQLAYADDPLPVVGQSLDGRPSYSEFNRYMFLKQDANGEWYWNTDFLFSCDTSASLATNREAMWQETRMYLQTGAFGDPADLTTLVMFWRKMEMLHYPGAAETKLFMEQRLAQQQQLRQQQQQLQIQMQQQMMQQQQEKYTGDQEVKREKISAEREKNAQDAALNIMESAQNAASQQTAADNMSIGQ